jgi:hypothetical protein
VWWGAHAHGDAVHLWAEHAAYGMSVAAVYDEGWGLIGHACDSWVELVVFRDADGRHLRDYAPGRERQGWSGPVLDCTVDELVEIRSAVHWRELVGDYVERHRTAEYSKACYRLSLVLADDIAQLIGGRTRRWLRSGRPDRPAAADRRHRGRARPPRPAAPVGQRPDARGAPRRRRPVAVGAGPAGSGVGGDRRRR